MQATRYIIAHTWPDYHHYHNNNSIINYKYYIMIQFLDYILVLYDLLIYTWILYIYIIMKTSQFVCVCVCGCFFCVAHTMIQYLLFISMILLSFVIEIEMIFMNLLRIRQISINHHGILTKHGMTEWNEGIFIFWFYVTAIDELNGSEYQFIWLPRNLKLTGTMHIYKCNDHLLLFILTITMTVTIIIVHCFFPCHGLNSKSREFRLSKKSFDHLHIQLRWMNQSE